MTHLFIERPKMAIFILGLWLPPENYKVLYLIYRNIQLLIIYTFLLFNIIYMVQVWGNLEATSEGSYLLFVQATLCLKCTTFVMNKDRLIGLISFMESEIFASRTPSHEKILSDQALKMWRLYLFFLMCDATNCSQWAIIPFLLGQQVFPFTIWMPVDPSTCTAMTYYIGYTYQMFNAYVGGAIYLTMDFFTVSMIMYAAAQLDIIGEKIKQIPQVALSADLNTEEKENLIKQNNDTLNECIQQHQAVVRFVKLVANMLNVNTFFQMSGTVAIVCIIGIHITTEPPDSMHFYSTVSYLVTVLSQLYLYCWCGNELTVRSQVLRDTLYTSPWYEQDQRFRKTIAIAMECMKRPIIFRAGYYIPLSRPTFVSILRCSYSYFAVLNQANSK